MAHDAFTLIDRFGRRVRYVRLSVTDRCDFRCVYCMADEMEFLPRSEVLSLEELLMVGEAFVGLGVDKIRLTGGEPLIRNNLVWLVERLARLDGLRELALTTNGSRLSVMAHDLRRAGLSTLNISLDTLDALRFREMTRTGDLDTVLAGIEAARSAGFDRIKLNSVILRGRNDEGILDLVAFAREQRLDISFIEEMPLGVIDEHDREAAFMPSHDIRKVISARWPLLSTESRTAGPSRYFMMKDSAIKVGFISPHSNNFCADCNRVRVTCEGRLLLCLGNEHSADLRGVLRDSPAGLRIPRVAEVIRAAMDLKPERHHFDLGQAPQIVRFMNMTGG
jgi:cyclic pyranopterin phosphate synthase